MTCKTRLFMTCKTLLLCISPEIDLWILLHLHLFIFIQGVAFQISVLLHWLCTTLVTVLWVFVSIPETWRICRKKWGDCLNWWLKSKYRYISNAGLGSVFFWFSDKPYFYWYTFSGSKPLGLGKAPLLQVTILMRIRSYHLINRYVFTNPNIKSWCTADQYEKAKSNVSSVGPSSSLCSKR